MGDATRSFDGASLVSTAMPAMRLEIDRSLAYLGATELEIKGLAHAERHHFVDARDGSVRRMLVVQFEGFLASNDEVYRYALPDPVTLGGETWGSWVFAYAVATSDAPETADSVRLLAGHGLALEDEQLMARYARILGPDARNEVLIFYDEPLRRLGHRLDSITDDADDGRIREEHISVAIELKARARRAFEVRAP
jgi:hypothetical protein